MNAKEKDRIERIERLREMIKPGDTIYTKLIHVSKSGMYRVIGLYVIRNNEPIWISGIAAPLLEGYDTRYEGCKAGGCGMDMGFHLVYNLSSILYGDGYACTGDNCPSNAHQYHYDTAPADAERGTTVLHRDGYAIRQRWL